MNVLIADLFPSGYLKVDADHFTTSTWIPTMFRYGFDDMKIYNEYFNKNVDNYAKEIMEIQPEFMKILLKVINKYTKIASKVLDVGNGGVINYSIENIDKLLCVDLEYNNNAASFFRNNKKIEFGKPDILDLENYVSDKFDLIIVQTVILHLAGNTHKKSVEKTKLAINDCLNQLNEVGKLVIIESTVEVWFEIVERILYFFMQLFFTIVKFVYTFQFSKKNLVKPVEGVENAKIIDYGNVNVGKYMWVMVKKIVRKFTPLGACFIIIEKKEN